MQNVGQKRMKPRRTPEQIKQDKINKLKNDITKLRQKKAVLRLELSQQRQNAKAAEFKARLDAIDQKVAEKMQQMRDTATGVVHQVGQKVGQVVSSPVTTAKRVWDDWQV